jgi:hypothetical protein
MWIIKWPLSNEMTNTFLQNSVLSFLPVHSFNRYMWDEFKSLIERTKTNRSSNEHAELLVLLKKKLKSFKKGYYLLSLLHCSVCRNWSLFAGHIVLSRYRTVQRRTKSPAFLPFVDLFGFSSIPSPAAEEYRVRRLGPTVLNVSYIHLKMKQKRPLISRWIPLYFPNQYENSSSSRNYDDTICATLNTNTHPQGRRTKKNARMTISPMASKGTCPEARV